VRRGRTSIRLLFEAEDHPPLTGARCVRPMAAITALATPARRHAMRSPTPFGLIASGPRLDQGSAQISVGGASRSELDQGRWTIRHANLRPHCGLSAKFAATRDPPFERYLAFGLDGAEPSFCYPVIPTTQKFAHTQPAAIDPSSSAPRSRI